MDSVAAFGRKVLIIAWTIISGLQLPSVGSAALRWYTTWQANRSRILVITAVNTTITTGNEFISREITAPFYNDSHTVRFFVREPSGAVAINRQSLINILMTVCVSLFGGPVFFIKRRWHRFVFFVSFGLFLSTTSQLISGLIRDGVPLILFGRLTFDFVYNGTVKYFMFEWGRKPILRAGHKFMNIGGIRLAQDLMTTMFRVTILNLLGFRG